MSYSAFEICTVQISDHPKRGVRAKCGHCPYEEAIAINTMKGHGDDDDINERMVIRKFENHGWKIGKTAPAHRCPSCYSAIKIASARKHKESEMENNKIVPINAESPRNMSREERRIIFERLNAVYLSEKVGYSEDWSDEKVAADVKAPRAWVSVVREEMFGPDINEHSIRIFTEAKELLTEINIIKQSADPIVQQLQKLIAKADLIGQGLKKMGERK